MTRKRTITIAAVLVLLLSLATSASAGSTVITADMYLPDITIEVTVPGQGGTFINPNGLSIVVEGGVENGQIISVPAHIENRSEFPVSVGVSVIGEARGKLTLNSSSLSSTNRRNAVFVYFQLRATEDPDPASVDWGDGYDEEKDILVVLRTRSIDNYVALAPVDQAERFGAFRLTGDCIVEPFYPWTEEDGFAATIVFTFKALVSS